MKYKRIKIKFLLKYNLCRYQNPRRINYLPKWIRTKVSHSTIKMLIIFIYIYIYCMNLFNILQWLHDGNYDLQTELEDFIAIQIARERGKQCVTDV